MTRLFDTKRSLVLTLQRFALAGAWVGIVGLRCTLTADDAPASLGSALAELGETAGALALLAGVAARPAALGFTLATAGAVASGSQDPVTALLVATLAVDIVIRGAGAFSIDRLLAQPPTLAVGGAGGRS